MACVFKKDGRGRPSKTMVCLADGCGKPYSDHTPSPKAVKAKAKKAGSGNPTAAGDASLPTTSASAQPTKAEGSPRPTAGIAAPSPTTEPTAASSVVSPSSADTENGSEVIEVANIDEARVAELRAGFSAAPAEGHW